MIRTKRLSIYIFKILSGILIGYIVSGLSEHLEITWILISVFLVLSPEGGDALELAVTRIKANLVGACIGFVLLAYHPPLIVSITAGALASMIICELISLSVGSRAALAALVIVIMDHEAAEPWSSGFHRVISVFLGCIIALLVTFVVHSIMKLNVAGEVNQSSREREA